MISLHLCAQWVLVCTVPLVPLVGSTMLSMSSLICVYDIKSNYYLYGSYCKIELLLIGKSYGSVMNSLVCIISA